MSQDRLLAEDWWTTSIIKMHPGSIRMRGYAIEDLIGRDLRRDGLAHAPCRAADTPAGPAA